jgi:hypothetical protein
MFKESKLGKITKAARQSFQHFWLFYDNTNINAFYGASKPEYS